MNENIFRRIFRTSMLRIKSMFEKNKKNGEEPRESGSSLLGTEGKVFGFWSWILPLLLGLTAGWFGMACLEVWLEGRNGQKRPFSVVSSLSDFAGETDADNMAAFLRTNPFNVTPMPVPEFAESEDEAPPQIVGSLATAVLKGTSPGYMAWMEDQGRLRLVMLGASFDVYTLEEVTYLNATFVRDGERVVKEIMYGGSPPAPLTERRPTEARAAADTGHVTPPDPGRGVPGVIGRDKVNQLLENPFDELRNVRIRPSENEQGLQVEWINNDSILAQLGVQEDDVIQGINGIVFRNAMDITNSLNSLMASDQFAVEVIRNGVPTLLHYEVR